jgi:hypothetical protein
MVFCSDPEREEEACGGRLNGRNSTAGAGSTAGTWVELATIRILAWDEASGSLVLLTISAAAGKSGH